VVLMRDDFSGGIGTNWESVSPTSGIDSTAGNTPPSLSLKAGSSRAEVRSNQRYSTLRGLTVAVDVQVSDGTYGDVLIVDALKPATIRTLVSVSKNGALLVIDGQSQTTSWTDGSGFHHFAFSLTAAGDGQWSRDGNVLMTGRYPVADIFVGLADFITGSNYDNVLVTSP